MANLSPSEREMIMKKKILIVDDDFSMRSLMKVVFEDEGYSVTLAGDGNCALKTLENGHFDIIITDVNMPRMNGVELFNNVKKLYPRIPVVFISGCDRKNLAEELLIEGALHFFTKPISIKILKSTIRNILRNGDSESKINIL